MRVVVTGATGFVARHLLPALAARDYEVVALGHDVARMPDVQGVRLVECDLSRHVDDLDVGAFDAVVHMAQANVPFPDSARLLFRVNTASTHDLLELAREASAARFVFTSSGSVYGLGEGRVAEDDPRRAGDFYAATKQMAESAVLAYRPYVATSILRLFAPYGPGQRGRLVPALVQRVRDGQPVTLVEGGRPRMAPIFVRDVAAVILAALDAPPSAHQLLNVAGDEEVSIRDLAERIGEVLGREPQFEEADGPATGDLLADNRRMHDLLGDAELVPLRDGLAATVAAEVPV